MTHDELRALDARVHREVMGHTIPEVCPLCNGTGKGEGHGAGLTCWACSVGTPVVPAYSSDIAAAWLVVEKLSDEEYVKVRCEQSHYRGNYCSIVAADKSQQSADCLVKQDVFGEAGETMPVAICLAALRAVQVPGGGAKVVACPNPHKS